MSDSTASPVVVPAGSRLATGLLLAGLTALSFGLAGALARGLIDAGWSPGAAVTARVWIGAILLFLPALISMRGHWHLLRRNIGTLVLYGILAVGATQLFYFQAVALMDVGVALLIEYMSPVAVVLWLWLRRGIRPTRMTVIGAVIAVAGLVLVLDLVSGARIVPAGVLWALGATVGSAAYFLLSAKQDDALPPMALAAFGLLIGASALTLAGVVGVLPMAWNTDDVSFLTGTVSWWVPVLALGVISCAVAYTFGIVSTRMLGARLAAFVALSEVVASVLFGWLLLGQMPTAVQLVGGALVLAGVVFVKAGEKDDPVIEDALAADGITGDVAR